MLINPVPAAIISTFVNPRQIAASTNASTVMYTVPSGKKFQGSLWASSPGGNVSIAASGGAAQQIALPSTSATALPTTLVAGTIVTNVSTTSTQYLIGVESDL